jgi:LuxR family maltose regulon positive regulatory protein
MQFRIHTLGGWSIDSKGNALQFNLKAPVKPLLILKALISFGGRNVKKEKIADALWPDANGDLANRALATTLHRLRRMLEIDKVITLSDGTLTLNSDICWVDVWEFERLCTECDNVWSRSTPENMSEAIQITLQAVNIYNGSFLPEEFDKPWTVFLRERLRYKYLRAVGKIGHYYEKSGLTENAVEWFQRSLETDHLDEESYRRLMACYYRIGKRSKALSVYNRCQRVLIEGLGIEPSRETEILRNSIILSEK